MALTFALHLSFFFKYVVQISQCFIKININLREIFFLFNATEMKEQLNRSEMTIKRLREIFKKTSQELREVCFELTGYKIDIPCNGQYKLTNIYAQSHRDYLLFQVGSNVNNANLPIVSKFFLFFQKISRFFCIFPKKLKRFQDFFSIMIECCHSDINFFYKEKMRKE